MVQLVDIAGHVLLFTLVFSMSATVDFNCFKQQIQNRTAIFSGIFLQFFIIPFIGFMVVNISNVPTTTGIILMVITTSPGGSYSNWWCSLFNADLALSVTMTACSTIISMIMLPANLLLYTPFCYDGDVLHQLDWKSIFMAVVILISAISLGLLCSYCVHSHRFNLWANRLGNLAGIALISFSAFMSNKGSGDKIWSRDWQFYGVTALPVVLSLIVSNALTSMTGLVKPERVSVSIESSYQNIGIATSLALTMFDGQNQADALGVPVFYGLTEAVCVGIYCIMAWKMGWTKAPANVSLWQALTTSYEVLAAEAKELQEIEITVSDSDVTPEHLNKEGSILTAYFYMPEVAVGPKEPSGEIFSGQVNNFADDAPGQSSNNNNNTNETTTDQKKSDDKTGEP